MEKRLRRAGGANSGVVHQVASSPRLRDAISKVGKALDLTQSALFRVALASYVTSHPQVDEQLREELLEATREIGIRRTATVDALLSVAPGKEQASPSRQGGS